MNHAGRYGIAAVVFGLVAAFLFVSSLDAQAPAAAPAQRPTFRTGVEYIEVDAHVVDGKNNPVRNLKKEDFHLFEDGKEQTIETFSAIDVPIESAASLTLGDTTRVEPDVSGNHYTAADSRVFVIVLDDFQIDPHRTQMTMRIAKDFINRNVGSHDLAAVMTTSGRTYNSQTLTNNKTFLLKAVDGFMGQKLPSEAISPPDDPTPIERFQQTSAALRSVESIATWMGQVRGRSKVMVLVSEGLDYNTDRIMDLFWPGAPFVPMVIEQEKEMIAAATRANVTIYPIDPRGLYAFDELTSVSNVTPAIRRAFSAEVDRAKMSLRLIADATGGDVSFRNDYQVVLDRIVSDHSSYYLLGYYPKNTRRDGKNRSISVKVNGRGLTVTSRSGYREAKDNAAPPPPPPGPSAASTELRDALNSPLPTDGVALAATAAAFRNENGKASIALILETPAGTIDVVEKDDRFTGAVEMATVAIDGRNQMAASDTTTINLQLTRESAERLKQDGFRALAKLDDLGPGRYQVRAAIGSAGSARRGSVWYDVDVPDFSKGELAMSGLVVASTEQGRMRTGNAHNLFGGVLPTNPTAGREFKSGDELVAFVEIYGARTPVNANLTAVVTDRSGREVIRRTESVAAADFETNDTYRFITRLPLSELTPGDYVLSLEAAAATAEAKPIRRAAPFRVVR